MSILLRTGNKKEFFQWNENYVVWKLHLLVIAFIIYIMATEFTLADLKANKITYQHDRSETTHCLESLKHKPMVK